MPEFTGQYNNRKGNGTVGKKMLFVFNPKAGKGKIKTHLLDIIDIFNKNDYEVIIRSTQKAKDAYEQAREYADEVDLIVCSGGDGTLDEVVTGIMEKKSDVPIGYIPAGSTNDFANSLFMPKNMTEAASMIMEEELYHCDIGRFNSQTFAYVAAFGLFTDVSYETDQDLKNVLGHVAYILEGVKRLFDIKSYHMKVKSEEIEVEDDFMVGMITNSRSVGGFKNLTGKNVDMNDGLFEVTLIVKPKNPLELQEIMTALVMAEDNTDLVHSFKTGKITIEAEEAVPWTLDGEFGGNHMSVEIENMHKALNLYLKSTKKN
jgi:diacylglycerol kinase (ATP)